MPSALDIQTRRGSVPHEPSAPMLQQRGVDGGQPCLVVPRSRSLDVSLQRRDEPRTHLPLAQLTGSVSVQPGMVSRSLHDAEPPVLAVPVTSQALGQKSNKCPAGPATAHPPMLHLTICVPSRSFGQVFASGHRFLLDLHVPSPHIASRLVAQGHTGVQEAASATPFPSAHWIAGTDIVPTDTNESISPLGL